MPKVYIVKDLWHWCTRDVRNSAYPGVQVYFDTICIVIAGTAATVGS